MARRSVLSATVRRVYSREIAITTTTESNTKVFSQQDEEIIRNNAMVAAYGYRTRANLTRQQGQQAESAGAIGTASALIGGFGTAVGIGGKALSDLAAGAENLPLGGDDWVPLAPGGDAYGFNDGTWN